jgi:hypothetical protein
MISENTKFELQSMLYSSVDCDYVRSLADSLLDDGIWIDDLDLAVGAEAKDNDNIRVVFTKICAHFEIEKVPIEKFKDLVLKHYCTVIVNADGNHEKVMDALYSMVYTIQEELRFHEKDKKCVGEGAGIERFIGPYYEYEEYPYYQMSGDQVIEARNEDIEQIIKTANQILDPTWTTPVFEGNV